MSDKVSPRPLEQDVHLSVFLHGLRLDFLACTTAAAVFVAQWRARHDPDAVTVVSDTATGFPRLPCERLYLEP